MIFSIGLLREREGERKKEQEDNTKGLIIQCSHGECAGVVV